MTRYAKFLAPVGMMMAAAVAMPAQAQVEGKIATVSIPKTVFDAKAFGDAQQQIQTTYGQQITMLQTKSQERQTLLAKYDKNGDKKIDDAEVAAMKKTPDGAKLDTLDGEIGALGDQIDGASVFAVEQILRQFGASLQDVVAAKQIKLVVEPGSLLYSPPEADITEAVVVALNARVPAVGVVPPAGWQPNQRAVQVLQQIQQGVMIAQYMQAQQAAAQGQQPAAPEQQSAQPAGR